MGAPASRPGARGAALSAPQGPFDPVPGPVTGPGIVGVVPLKAIPAAKTRLSGRFGADERAVLLRRTFGRVVAALVDSGVVHRVVVVVGDDLGLAWAQDEGVDVAVQPGSVRGLNAALAWVDGQLGEEATLVLPADLPLVRGEDLRELVADLPAGPAVVVAPTADGGTGALLRRPGGVVAPAYGVGSAERHLSLARAAGAAAVRRDLPGLALDLDRPEDVEAAGGWQAVVGGAASGRRASG